MVAASALYCYTAEGTAAASASLVALMADHPRQDLWVQYSLLLGIKPYSLEVFLDQWAMNTLKYFGMGESHPSPRFFPSSLVPDPFWEGGTVVLAGGGVL